MAFCRRDRDPFETQTGSVQPDRTSCYQLGVCSSHDAEPQSGPTLADLQNRFLTRNHDAVRRVRRGRPRTVDGTSATGLDLGADQRRRICRLSAGAAGLDLDQNRTINSNQNRLQVLVLF